VHYRTTKRGHFYFGQRGHYDLGATRGQVFQFSLSRLLR